jgi:hypothetical protein
MEVLKANCIEAFTFCMCRVPSMADSLIFILACINVIIIAMQALTIEKLERDNKKALAIRKYLVHFEAKQKRETKISLSAGLVSYIASSRFVQPVGYRLSFAMLGYLSAMKAIDLSEQSKFKSVSL